MAEQLTAQLGLELGAFTASINNATNQFRTFASTITQQVQQINQAFAGLPTAIQNVLQAERQLAQAMQTKTQATQQQGQAVQQVTQRFNTYNTQLHQVNIQLNQFNQTNNTTITTLNNVQQQIDRHASVWSGWRVSIRAVESALLALGGTLVALAVKSVSAFADLETGLAKVGTQIEGFNAKQLGAMGDQVRALSIQFGTDTAAILKALFDIHSANFSVADSFKILAAAGVLAVGGLASFDDTTKATISVLKAYHLTADDATRVTQALFRAEQQARADMDEFARGIGKILPVAAELRVDFRDLGALLAILNQQGITFNRAVTQVERALVALAAPAKQAEKYLGAVGEATGQGALTLKRFSDGTLDVVSTFKQFEGIPADLITKMIPRIEGQRAVLSFASNMAQLREEVDRAHRAGTGLADAYRLVEATIKQAFKEMWEAANAFLTKLGEIISHSPGFVQAINQIKAAFVALTQSLSDTTSLLFKALTIIQSYIAYASQGFAGLSQRLTGELQINEKIFETYNRIVSLQKQLGTTGEKIGNFGVSLFGGKTLAERLAEEKANYEALIAKSNELRKVREDALKPKIGVAPEGAVVPPPGMPPVISKAAVDASLQAQKEAAAEGKRLANERAQVEEQLSYKILELRHEEFEAERQTLDKDLAYWREISVNKTIVNEFEAAKREDIAKREAEATVAEFRKATKAYFDALNDQAEVAQRIQEEITALEAKESKSRVDDFLAAMAKKKEAYIQAGARVEDIQALETATQKRALQIQTDETQKELDKQRRAYEQMAQDIARPIQSIFENLLTSTGNILESLKSMFFRFLAQIAAQALATQVIIPVLIGVAGGGGAFAGIATSILGAAGGTGAAGGMSGAGGGGGGWFGYAQQGYGVASTGSALLGGPSASSLFGLGSMTLADFGIGAGVAPTAATLAAEESAGLAASGAATPTALGATSLGTLASGVGAGLSVALIVNELNKLVGLSGGGVKGAAGGALAGAAGGAVVGSIVPVIGTTIGAIVGAALGAIFGGLFGGGGGDPRLKINYAQAGMVDYSKELGGLHITQPFTLGEVKTSRIPTQGKISAISFLDETINDMFQQVINGFKGLSPLLQESIVGQLNASAEEFRQYLMHGPAIEGEDIKAELEKFVTKTLPNYFKDAFGKLESAVKKLDPYVRAYEKVIDQSKQILDNLSRAQAQAHISLAQGIVSIKEGLFSPAQQFMARQQDLSAAMELLATASPQQQLALIPQIQQLAQQIFQLGMNEAVLGQDPQALRNLQADLIRQLSGFNVNIDASFGTMKTDVQAQLDAANQQVSLLVASVSNLDTIDDTLRQSLPVLQGIEAALAPYGVNAQGDAQLQIQGSMLDVQQQQLQVLQSINAALAGTQERQHGGYIPFNTFATLHAGERVVPAYEQSGGGNTYNIYLGSGNTVTAKDVIREIEKRGGRLGEGTIMVKH